MNPGFFRTFVAYLQADRPALPIPVAEYRFHPVRKWRFDMAWIDEKVAVEVQGGLFVDGRHARGAALRREYEKLREAALLGWTVLLYLPEDILKKKTLDEIERGLYLGRERNPVQSGSVTP